VPVLVVSRSVLGYGAMIIGVSTPAGRRVAVGVVRVGGPSNKHHASKYNTSTASQFMGRIVCGPACRSRGSCGTIDSHGTHVRILSVSVLALRSGDTRGLSLCVSACVCSVVACAAGPELFATPQRQRVPPGHGGGGSLAKPWAQRRHIHSSTDMTPLRSWGRTLGALDLNAGLRHPGKSWQRKPRDVREDSGPCYQTGDTKQSGCKRFFFHRTNLWFSSCTARVSRPERDDVGDRTVELRQQHRTKQ
jgi:hypothetical protein